MGKQGPGGRAGGPANTRQPGARAPFHRGTPGGHRGRHQQRDRRGGLVPPGAGDKNKGHGPPRGRGSGASTPLGLHPPRGSRLGGTPRSPPTQVRSFFPVGGSVAPQGYGGDGARIPMGPAWTFLPAVGGGAALWEPGWNDPTLAAGEFGSAGPPTGPNCGTGFGLPRN